MQDMTMEKCKYGTNEIYPGKYHTSLVLLVVVI